MRFDAWVTVLSSCDVPVLAIMSSEDLHTRTIGWHDWQQQKRFTFWTGVQRRMASKDICWPIITIIVQPWSGAALAKCRVAVGARTLEVLARNIHCNPEASRKHDAHWPDFEVEFIGLTRDERLLVVVCEVGPIRP